MALLVVPALAYMINNNLVMYVHREMDVATFSVLANLKILTTALSAQILTGTHLSTRVIHIIIIL